MGSGVEPDTRSCSRHFNLLSLHGRRIKAAVLLPFAILLIVLSNLPVFSQSQPASLIADRLRYDANTGALTASGNVKIFHDGRILSAPVILYNAQEDKLSLPDGFTLTENGSVIQGRQATIDAQLETAIILGAKALIQERLTIEADRITRYQDGTSNFDTIVASTCTTCAARPVPFWQIRASRIIHDPEAQRLHYENAQLEIVGVPVPFPPRFSTPEPGVSRASGFLAPQLVTNTTLGIGGKIPYFKVIDAYSDVTLTPFVTSKGGPVLEAEYRRRTKNGAYSIDGAVAFTDDLSNESLNGFVRSVGEFNLKRNYVLDYEINLSSDFDQATETGFMETYGYSDDDRLPNFIRLSRTKTDSYFEVSAGFTQSFRVSDTSADIPVILPNAYFREKHSRGFLGGSLEYSAYATGLSLGTSQYYSRLGGVLHWQNSWITQNGIVISADAQLIGNAYVGAGTNTFSVAPVTAVEVRYPLALSTATAQHVIEPIVQLVWSRDKPWGTPIQNVDANDSTTAEFEETNLFSLNRFPGYDEIEAGLRANVGVRYLRYAQSGWELGVTVGRVFRSANLGQFNTTNANGLSQQNSDYVAAVSLALPGKLEISSRMLFGTDFQISKNELELAYSAKRFSGEIRYVYLNDILGTAQQQHEIGLLAQYRLDNDWALAVDWRENLVTNRTIDGTIGLIYESDCARLQFSFSVEYDSNGQRETEFGMQLSLLGFGGNPNYQNAAHRCKG